MAELLGGRSCIESLQSDVQDVQAAVSDVFSRIGPVKFPSWKYPDKMSCDLEIEELLETYTFSDDEEHCQMSHIVLYELVIDRLVLFVQCLVRFSESLLSQTKGSGDTNVPTSSSIGLVVRRYWNRLLQLNSSVQQLMSDNKSKGRKVSDLENQVKKLSNEITQIQAHGALSRTSSLSGLIPPSKADLTLGGSGISSPSGIMLDISKDACSKSSQTIETAFVPCESCAGVQKNLRDTGDAIINICQSQGLPSSLLRFKPQVAVLDWFTVIDVTRWTSEQNKDMNRINKHLEQLYSTIDPLKEKIQHYEIAIAKMEEKCGNFNKELKLERDTQSAQQKQFETKVKDIEFKHSETVTMVTKQKNELLNNQEELTRQLQLCRLSLQEKEVSLCDLETVKVEIEKDLLLNKVNAEEIGKLEKRNQELDAQLDDVTSKLDNASKQLMKEQAINKSASKHSSSLQSKQETLLQRVDEMDQENEELRNDVADLEDEREALQETINKTQAEVKHMITQAKEDKELVAQLNDEKQDLEASISDIHGTIQVLLQKLEAAKQQERLLVEFPDLNGPVNSDLQGSGDIVRDMECQIQANSIRIQILESQNDGLRNSVSKLMTASHLAGGRDNGHPAGVKDNFDIQVSKPLPLWETGRVEKAIEGNMPVKEEQHYQHTSFRLGTNTNNNSAVSSDKKPPAVRKGKTITVKNSPDPQDEFFVGRPLSGSKKKMESRSRPASGKTSGVIAPASNSSIGTYLKLKKAGKLGSQQNRVTSEDDSDKYSYPATYVCSRCDKMYHREHDLEIHQSYCTA